MAQHEKTGNSIMRKLYKYSVVTLNYKKKNLLKGWYKMSVFKRFKSKLNWVKYNKERKMLKALNKNLRIYGKIVIKNPEKIEIGYDCRLNDYSFLHGGGGLRIGDNVTVSAFAKIISWGYNTQNWPANYITKDHVGEEIHLGNGTWVGAGATILPGVKLNGTGIIVAAGSVVTKSFYEDFILIGGSPAKVLKRYKTEEPVTSK